MMNGVLSLPRGHLHNVLADSSEMNSSSTNECMNKRMDKASTHQKSALNFLDFFSCVRGTASLAPPPLSPQQSMVRLCFPPKPMFAICTCPSPSKAMLGEAANRHGPRRSSSRQCKASAATSSSQHSNAFIIISHLRTGILGF